ncbi:MAG: sugar ABC transporter substrate-binding protein [Ruminococcus sp.]|nr:sugar ABC transporter substrate-binding protein [Ruminococcus sp.]
MTKSKVLSTLLAASLIFSATAGCNSKTKKTNNNNSTTQQEIRTYTGFFAAQIGSVDENNVVKNLIAEKIGARCEETWLDETGNRDNIISNMIIQNEYPDFIYPDAANYQKLLQAGALSPIDAYWDDYPNVKNYFSQAQWNRIREDDGHIYMIPVFSNCYMYDTNTLHNDEAFWIQVKVLKWGGYPKITTLDEYFDLLERYVEANPIAEDGTPNIGYEILADPTIFFCLDNPPQFLAGYPNDGCCIVDPDTLEAVDYNLSDTAKRWFKKLNEEYKKGIIDPDCFVLNQDQYYDKIRTGNVLGMADQKWNFQIATYELPDECQYVPLGVVIDEGIEEHYHSQPAFDDSMGITISTSCDDVEGALKFLNDLLSPEILTLRFWGIEGKDYMVDDDGLFYCTDEQTANRSNSEYAYKNLCEYTYFPYYFGMNHDGINAYCPAYQPSEFYKGLGDIMKECFDAYGVKTYVEMLNKAEENPAWYPMWSYSNTFTTDTDYGRALKSIEQTKLKYLPNVVMSNDFESVWNEYVTEYEKCNPKVLFDELTREVKRRVDEQS